MDKTHLSSNNDESTTCTSKTKSSCRILASPAKINVGCRPHHENSLRLQELLSKNEPDELQAQTLSPPCSFSSPSPRQHVIDTNDKEKDGGRERLKRHREEVAGKVMIPDAWNQENFLMDWIDYSSFDKLLAANGIASAREALMAQGRRGRASSQRLRIESRC